MNLALPAAAALAAEFTRLSSRLGARVVIEPHAALDRSADTLLAPPGRISANGGCRLVRARDAWIAVNLPRPSDADLAPAWLECDDAGATWACIEARAPGRAAADLLDRARLLGLAVARVGETQADDAHAPLVRFAPAPASPPARGRLRVIDLSSLWAGPLCGSLIALMGADVVKLESVARPDAGRDTSLFARLNGAKAHASFDHRCTDDIARLRARIAQADVLITSARARAFDQLGLAPDAVFETNPGLVWVAITGHGWESDRVGFGDDAAASGGLVRWRAGAPRFAGDALADPLTGLAGAVGALRALEAGGGVMVDASLARTAAGAAALAAVATL